MNVKLHMSNLDVNNAESLDRSQDHAVSVTLPRRKKNHIKDIVEIVSRFINFPTVCSVSITESSLEDAPTVV